MSFAIGRYVLLPLMLVFAISAAHSAEEQKLVVDGMEIFYGILSEERVHADEDSSFTHRGLLRKHRRHLTVALFDAETKQRISDATINATVTPLGLAPTRKRLKQVRINEAVTYDHFFEFPPDSSPFRIVLKIDRPNQPTHSTTFEYRP